MIIIKEKVNILLFNIFQGAGPEWQLLKGVHVIFASQPDLRVFEM